MEGDFARVWNLLESASMDFFGNSQKRKEFFQVIFLAGGFSFVAGALGLKKTFSVSNPVKMGRK
jgi:hypothetical protein